MLIMRIEEGRPSAEGCRPYMFTLQDGPLKAIQTATEIAFDFVHLRYNV